MRGSASQTSAFQVGGTSEFHDVTPIADVGAQHTKGLRPCDTRPNLGVGQRLLVSGDKGLRREGARLPAINHHARLYNYLGT